MDAGFEQDGFACLIPADTGRPANKPGDLLKLYMCGYFNRVRSSRLLEHEVQRNVEMIWLLKKLMRRISLCPR